MKVLEDAWLELNSIENCDGFLEDDYSTVIFQRMEKTPAPCSQLFCPLGCGARLSDSSCPSLNRPSGTLDL